MIAQMDIWLLGGLALCVLAASVLFVAAVGARRQELIDRRLRPFAPETEPEKRPALPPARIDLERRDAEEKPAAPALRFLRPFPGVMGRQPLARRLIKAGLDPDRWLRPFLIARLLCFAAYVILSTLLLDMLMPGMATTAGGVVSIGFSAAVGSFLPHILLNYRIKQRQRRIEQAMPDMVDLLILCVEAGLTLEVALARAIEGLQPFAPDVAEEMRITLSELRILPDKSMALTNLEKRTASRSLKFLVLSLRQSERYGTSITGALKAVAAENRKLTMLELENNAARMPALLSIPLILFILPPVVALSAGPGFALMMRAIGG
ncbi:hypothetical protein GQF03_08935 [Sneathiella chungangensis]|uniref:Type II secretion system protein GspF domain-containing protein n=2 Tax=Sneathiella chungangensis TaxID=1418234 RepID=A0A845MGJ4_9PROT|nr:type II secretion system F family protein [Sneathiella chungangensis]MZR22456.1 hypothetical protein [Sneathiella chungangensis]